MNSSKNILPLARLYVRKFSQTAATKQVKEVPSSQFLKLKEKQKLFQIDNGIPVFLKGGMFDRILYQGTIVGLMISLGMGIQTFLVLATRG